jgi:hypothetical protein
MKGMMMSPIETNMNVSITRVKLDESYQQELSQEAIAKKIQLFISDEFQASRNENRTTEFSSGLELSSASSGLTAALGQADTQQQNALIVTTHEFVAKLLKNSAAIEASEDGALPSEVQHAFEEVAQALADVDSTLREDPDVFLNGVVLSAYDMVSGDVEEIAKAMEKTLDGKKELKEEIADWRELQDDFKDGKNVTLPDEFLYDEAGKPLSLTAEQIEKKIENTIEELEGVYEGLGGDQQLLQLQLQDALNKQQQLVQMLSNIMKKGDDTLKAIIQNLK